MLWDLQGRHCDGTAASLKPASKVWVPQQAVQWVPPTMSSQPPVPQAWHLTCRSAQLHFHACCKVREHNSFCCIKWLCNSRERGKGRMEMRYVLNRNRLFTLKIQHLVVVCNSWLYACTLLLFVKVYEFLSHSPTNYLNQLTFPETLHYARYIEFSLQRWITIIYYPSFFWKNWSDITMVLPSSLSGVGTDL